MTEIFLYKLKIYKIRGAWLAHSVEPVTLDLEAVSSSPTLGIKIILYIYIFYIS